MSQQSKSDEKAVSRRKLAFRKRITVTLDQDVQELANDSAKRTDWVSQAHFVNACIRRATSPFASPEISVRVSQFEQLAFAKRIKIKSR